MLFSYRCSWWKSQIKFHAFLFMSMLLLMGIAYLGKEDLFVFGEEDASRVKEVFSWVLALSASFAAIDFILHFNVSGEWEVKLSENYVTWKSPENLKGGGNFKIKIDEIEFTRVEREDIPDGYSYHYYMKPVNYPEFLIRDGRSGVPMADFFAAIEKLGIPRHYLER